MERYFFVDCGAKIGETIVINGQEHLHISKVLRLKVDDEIVCLPNDNTALRAKIVSISKQSTLVQVIGYEQSFAECMTNVTVFVACVKGDKFEFLIQKLTELGIKRLVAFESEYITAKPSIKEERHLLIAREACKQCRRTKILQVDNPIKFEDMLKELSDFDIVVFANEYEKQNALNDVDFKNANNVAVVIGSEGGFSTREVEQIKDAGAHSITLGNRILRAETAGLIVPALVQYRLGEFNYKNN